MNFKTIEEIQIDLAQRFKKIRKIKGLTQKELAIQSNVSYGSIKRFENSGEISLNSLIKLCNVLDLTDEINNLFKNISFKDISEVIKYGK